jgi:hypothetical protein
MNIKKYSTAIIVFSFVVMVLAIAYKDALTSSFIAGVTPLGLIFSFFKSFIVAIVLIVAIPVALVALLIDLVLWFITPYYFPLSGFMYNLVWENITIEWYWLQAGGNEIFYAALILALVGIAVSRKRKHTRSSII